MLPENAAATHISESDGALDGDNSDDDDADGASYSFLLSPGDNPSQDVPIEWNRGSSWISGSRLIVRLRSWFPLSFSRGNGDLYNAAPATEAGRYRVGMNTSRKKSVAISGSCMSIVFTLRAIVCCSWGNLLLVFVPIGIVTYISKAHPSIIFASNAIAIIPLSGLLAYATENIASDMGDTVGALMNISFGNLVEVIILTALFNNQIRIVQASLLGSILVNLLLILGTAIIAGSFQDQEQAYSISNSQALACLLSFSVFSLLIPLKSHAYLASPVHHHEAYVRSRIGPLVQRSQEQSHTRGSSTSSISRTIRFADEDLRLALDSNVMAKNIKLDTIDSGQQSEPTAETTVQSVMGNFSNHIDQPNGGIGGTTATGQGKAGTAYLPCSAAHSSSVWPHSLRTPPNQDELLPPSTTRQGLVRSASSIPLLYFSRGSLDHAPNDDFSNNSPIISRATSLVLLISSSVLVAFCAEFLVNTIDDMVAHSPLSEPFIGLIILPVAGNVAEHITAVTVAAKNKMDLAIGVSVGSSIQIALFVTPLVVIMGWIMDRDMTLYFSLFETVTLVATTFLVNFVILDGRTNYMEGSLLCACYVIIGVGAYLFPGPDAQSPG
ncbi:uncharacterized protein BP5553_09211 [Venustampulla echinocandica]|uniref:Sodium/calcium exchanger membrane region domain-containing protein n=1 Tax=Venustampulla echinocandica TaxID=2656787 RepID=A0A370TC30_9HELO|nr:uncharacterized protein BP5553_09211 [Venustampulla echinocandica]RDL31809.1 hypothetical protein BP5553_09211 [Venustampulla echinocandica]